MTKLTLNPNSIFLKADSYKFSHSSLYPEGITKAYSYIESRGGRTDKHVMFGLQKAIKDLAVPTVEDVQNAALFAKLHGVSFDMDRAMQLAKLGYLPLEIKAVPEGLVLNNRNILVSVENTHPDFAWLVSFLETYLLQTLWYGVTIATYSYDAKEVLKQYVDSTTDNFQGIDFMLHDFGERGASSMESSGLAGAAHLISFMGTDNIPGIVTAYNYYGFDQDKMIGFSVNASEHSTVCSYGKENEVEAYRTMIKNHPTGILSMVSDSYDIYNAVDNIFGKELKEDILNRDGVFVIRPDSGDPLEVLPYILNSLGTNFGYNVNSKGFKVLNDKVRVLQGDGINLNSIGEICKTITDLGWSIENLVFGMGGALTQSHSRDELEFAMKCSYVEINGVGRDVYKDPITSKGSKTSKKGKQVLLLEEGVYKTVPMNDENKNNDQLVTVFKDGTITKEYTFEEVRDNIKK